VIGGDFLWLSVVLLAVSMVCAVAFAVLMWRQNHSDELTPVVTRTGKALTDQEIQALADEAERGYNVREFKRR
jgi:hypothetical protein